MSNDKLCFIYGCNFARSATPRERFEDYKKRNDPTGKSWHIATLATGSFIERTIDCLPRDERCPDSQKRWIMCAKLGQSAQQFVVEHSRLANSAPPHGQFCPACLAMLDKVTEALNLERTDDMKLNFSIPIIVDSANNSMQQANGPNLLAAEELAKKLAEENGRPFTILIPHSTYQPVAPVKRVSHNLATLLEEYDEERPNG